MNAHLNNARKITCIPKALSDQVETKPLYLYPNKNRGRHSLLPLHAGEKVTVNTTTLDNFVRDADIAPQHVKFVKIDVEGYEYFVLRGAQKLLSHLPLLHTEFSLPMMKQGGIEPQWLVDLVMGYGFQPFVIDERGKLHSLTKEQLLALDKIVDVLWKKEDIPPADQHNH